MRWQIEQIEDGLRVEQATVLFDPDTGRDARAMRTKEDAADYRYSPIPTCRRSGDRARMVERVRAAMPELPRAQAERFVRLRPARVRRHHADAEPGDGGLFRGRRRTVCAQPKLVSNWVMGEVSRRPTAEERDIAAAPVAAALAALIARIADGTISNNAAQPWMRSMPARRRRKERLAQVDAWSSPRASSR